jgi:hypothetical protein
MPKFVEHACCVCGERLQFGPSTYPGRPVAQWGRLIICNECARDTIVIAAHPELPGRIEAAGGKFILNSKGDIVVPPRGSN